MSRFGIEISCFGIEISCFGVGANLCTFFDFLGAIFGAFFCTPGAKKRTQNCTKSAILCAFLCAFWRAFFCTQKCKKTHPNLHFLVQKNAPFSKMHQTLFFAPKPWCKKLSKPEPQVEATNAPFEETNAPFEVTNEPSGLT